MTPKRALESIAAELQRQYERWQAKARYKPSLDPTQEDIKKLCMTLRRNARVCIRITNIFLIVAGFISKEILIQKIRIKYPDPDI